MEPGLEVLQQWIGRTERYADALTPTPYAALSASLDRPGVRPAEGTPLPPLWHWLYFLPLHRASELGEDGHARRGGFLPPVGLPRRMWAGGQFRFEQPLCIGQAVERRSVIENVSAKEGRSGPLVFVKVRHEITPAGAQAAALTEHQDLVYRAAHDPAEAPPAPRPAPEPAAFQRTWVADDVLLFRYSALTFNGHRIHYDRRYVTQAEGYPGLVVHGPLIATLLVQVLLEAHPGARLRRFEFRALRPLFDGAPFSVCGAPQAEPGHFRLWARDPAGWLAMDASALID